MLGKKAHRFKNHIFIAIGILIILWYMNNSHNWIKVPIDTISLIKMAAIGLIYSNMPDIDQPGSKINKYFTVILIAIILLSFYFQAYMAYGILAAVILLMIRFINHRTLIHSVVGAVIISAPLFYFGFIYFIVGFVAFMTHIISDGEFSIFAEKDWW